jgi:hypothetical protein
MQDAAPLSPEQVREFRETGLLVLRGFYDRAADVEPIRRGIHAVIGEVMRRHDVADTRGDYEPERFERGYPELIARDRAIGGEVYDAIKQLPDFHRLVCHPRNDAVFRQLRPGSIPGIAGGGSGIRIDNPFEDKYRALWHQEYPAQLRSRDGIVFWSPLLPVSAEMGPVTFCPGSHREGPLPVCSFDPDGSGRSGAYALVLRDEAAILSRYEQVAPLTEPGDLVLIDFLLLHCSGRNVARRSRWTVQLRYFNFAEETGRRHGWQGSYAAGVDFRKIHPELYCDPGEGGP